MYLFGKDLSIEVVVIAEIGVNHEGDIETALKLIQYAAASGADAVKFQSYTPERYIATNDSQRLARVKKFCLNWEAHELLANEAEQSGIVFFSTPASEDWIKKLVKLSDVGKIASGDLTFEPMIREAARSFDKLIISTGASTIDEIDRTVGWVKEEIGSDSIIDRLILMHCVTQYPTSLNNVNIRSVNYMNKRYNMTIGYSNHVIEPEACIAAVALGARVIEVHFTDQKHGREFRDHAISFEPQELEKLVTTIKKINLCLGENVKVLQAGEEEIRSAFRKGIVAGRSLNKGVKLTTDDLMYARPATEFNSEELPQLIGSTLKRGLKSGELICKKDVVLVQKNNKITEDGMLVIIPARGGSKGVPRKNIRPLAGRPLIDYTIKAALAAKNVTRVIVDTEDKEIAEIAIECGAEVPFMRPANLATDTVPNGASCLHLIQRLRKENQEQYDDFVLIQATSPFIQASDIDSAISLYRQRRPIAVVSLRPLETPLEAICEVDDNGFLISVMRDKCGIDFLPDQRQRYKDRYAISGAINVLSTEYMQKDINYFYGNRDALSLVLDDVRGHDIDTMNDFIVAEYIAEQLNGRKCN